MLLVPPLNILVRNPSPLKFVWFRMLKNSARNSSIPPSPRKPSFVCLTMEKSQSLSGGPLKILRPAVPSWPMKFPGQLFGSDAGRKKQDGCSELGLCWIGGSENMAGLNHWLGSPVMTVLG